MMRTAARVSERFPMRVFLVDDSLLVRVRLAKMLQDLWQVEKVIEAGTVAEAQGLLPDSNADVVIVDMRLPDGDGLEVLRAAKRMQPTPAVIVLTNYAYDQLRATCLEAGADEFLDKRTEFERLPAIVTELGRRAVH
jgi:DNA-binding NarL/FixJ family response regulator